MKNLSLPALSHPIPFSRSKLPYTANVPLQVYPVHIQSSTHTFPTYMKIFKQKKLQELYGDHLHIYRLDTFYSSLYQFILILSSFVNFKLSCRHQYTTSAPKYFRIHTGI